jgi:hypothetical protein
MTDPNSKMGRGIRITDVGDLMRPISGFRPSPERHYSQARTLVLLLTKSGGWIAGGNGLTAMRGFPIMEGVEIGLEIRVWAGKIDVDAMNHEIIGDCPLFLDD